MRIITRVIFRVFIVILMSMAMLLTFLTITEYRPDDIEALIINNNQDETLKLDEPYRFMTFNIGYAGLGATEDFVMDGGEKGRPDSEEVVENFLTGILNVMEEHSVDFYLMQEVDLFARRSYQINQVSRIRNHLGEDYHSVFALNFRATFVPFPLSLTDFIGPVQSGLQTLSTFEVIEANRHQFPGSFDWPLRIANLKRAMLVTTYNIADSDKQLVVINHHMSAYDDGGMRSQEMAYLRDFIQSEYEKGNYVVVGGDFNHLFPGTRDQFPLDEVLRDYWNVEEMSENFFGDDFVLGFDSSIPTCRLLHQPFNPSDPNNIYDPNDPESQFYVIDGFLVSKNIEINLIYNVDQEFKYSDHNPVVIEIVLLSE